MFQPLPKALTSSLSPSSQPASRTTFGIWSPKRSPKPTGLVMTRPDSPRQNHCYYSKSQSRPCSQMGFGSTRSQVRILSPRLVTARVLGNVGNPFLLSARESAREQGVSGLALLTCGHGPVVAGVRTNRQEMGPEPEFLLHLLQTIAEAQPCGRTASSAGLRPAAAVLQRATAGPWPASASRRRPPLWGR